MKTLTKIIFVTLVVGVFSQSINAQVAIKRRIKGGDGIFHLKELQAILTSKTDTVKILTVLPEDLRPEGYEDIMIKENDEILMLNAKRIKSVKTFEEMYNNMKIGETVKMGIRRKGELLIESFEKIAPDKLPKGQNIMIKTGEPGKDDEKGGVRITRTFTTGGGEMSENMQPWFGTGLMLGFVDNKIKVTQVMEGMTAALGKADIKQDDVITSLNGQKMESLEKFLERYENLKVGSKVEITYSRNGKKMKAIFNKPEVKGRMIIRKN